MSDDIVARLREEGFVTHMARLPRESKILHDAADEIERLRSVVEAWLKYSQRAERDIETLRAERDEARLQMGRIFNEIDCRIEHGAESNGHLEAIRNLFKEATDGK